METLTANQLEELFILVELLKNVNDINIHHPEKCCFNHSKQVVSWAIKETDDLELIIAALLHDVGKSVNVYKHAKIGPIILLDLKFPFLNNRIMQIISDHMMPQLYLDGDMRRFKKRNSFLKHPYLLELLQLRRWDLLGRNVNKNPNWDNIKSSILNKFQNRLICQLLDGDIVKCTITNNIYIIIFRSGDPFKCRQPFPLFGDYFDFKDPVNYKDDISFGSRIKNLTLLDCNLKYINSFQDYKSIDLFKMLSTNKKQ